jgi:hypothetical protein
MSENPLELMAREWEEMKARLMALETQVRCEEWVDVPRGSEITGLSQWTIRQMVRQGKFEIYQPNPGRPPLRIKRDSLRSL